MIAENLKLKSVVASFALLCLLTASSAWAQITSTSMRITSFNVPPSIDNPLNVFSVSYTITAPSTAILERPSTR